MAGLAPTFGRGAMTNTWADIKNADLIVIMGGNAAEAHPCGFKWVTEAKHHNHAKLIVVDPRFTRSAAMADLYMPIRAGTDIAWLGGVINYLLSHDKIQHEYVLNYTNASFLVKDEFGFEDGLFTGYDAEKRDYDKSSWDYQIGADGSAITDGTLRHPRCVYQMMRQHYSRYTPEMVSRITGTPRDKFLEACAWIAETAAPDKAMTSMYALGWTQHSKGAQNIRTMAMIQLLLGNIGVAGGGMNALRGHSNIQGLTDLGLMSDLIPGYMKLPLDNEQDRAAYFAIRKFTPLAWTTATASTGVAPSNQISYFQNYGKFFTSFLKAMYGRAATAENDYCYDWLPKLDKVYDVLRVFDLMHQGKMTGYFCQGFNPLMAFPNKAKVRSALSQLKFLVVMDPLATETASFWERPRRVQREQPGGDQDGGVPPSHILLRRRVRLADQFRTLAAVALESRRPARGGDHRCRDHGQAFPQGAGAVPGGRRSVPGADPQSALALRHGRGTDDRGDRQGNQRLRRRRCRRCAGPDEDRAEGGAAGRQFRPVARRRQDRLRMLDLLRLLDQRRQSDGAARHRRSGACGFEPQLGLGLAGQPPHPLQPRLLRHAGTALQPEAPADRVERQPVERHRCPRFSGDVPALGGGRAVHHESGRRFPVLCP